MRTVVDVVVVFDSAQHPAEAKHAQQFEQAQDTENSQDVLSEGEKRGHMGADRGRRQLEGTR